MYKPALLDYIAEKGLEEVSSLQHVHKPNILYMWKFPLWFNFVWTKNHEN